MAAKKPEMKKMAHKTEAKKHHEPKKAGHKAKGLEAILIAKTPKKKK